MIPSPDFFSPLLDSPPFITRTFALFSLLDINKEKQWRKASCYTRPIATQYTALAPASCAL